MEQFIDDEKVVMLAELYKAYVNEEITWDEFTEFSEITNRLFMSDIKLLNLMWENNYSEYNENRDDSFRLERIYSLGIIGNSFPTITGVKHFYGKVLNQLGKKYCDIIFVK